MFSWKLRQWGQVSEAYSITVTGALIEPITKSSARTFAASPTEVVGVDAGIACCCGTFTVGVPNH
jgi:hypothetical protein